jgi:hypothetical protein
MLNLALFTKYSQRMFAQVRKLRAGDKMAIIIFAYQALRLVLKRENDI